MDDLAAAEEQADAAAGRWAEAHAGSLGALREYIAGTAAPPGTPPNADAVLDDALAGLLDAEARARAAHGASRNAVVERVDEHEAALDDMYAAVHAARRALSRIDPARAADRGEHSLHPSCADRAMALSARARAYEAELQVTRRVVGGLRPGAPANELRTLLFAWEAQPMLAGVHEAAREMDEARRSGGAAGELEPG